VSGLDQTIEKRGRDKKWKLIHASSRHQKRKERDGVPEMIKGVVGKESSNPRLETVGMGFHPVKIGAEHGEEKTVTNCGWGMHQWRKVEWGGSAT